MTGNVDSSGGAISAHQRMTLRANAAVFVPPSPWYCCIDVECVASGMCRNDRAVARVALVDMHENVLMDQLVKPRGTIVSYLTPITGIEVGDLDDAPCLEDVVQELIRMLPKNTVIIGQGIQHDIDWLGLKRGVDFKDSFDIADLFKVDTKNGRKIGFSLRHEVLHLDGFVGAGSDIQGGIHDASVDAIFSMRVFLRFHSAPEYDVHLAKKNCFELLEHCLCGSDCLLLMGFQWVQNMHTMKAS